MAPNKVIYTCPVCGSHSIFHDVKLHIMDCNICDNSWFVNLTDMILPTEDMEAIATEELPCAL